MLTFNEYYIEEGLTDYLQAKKNAFANTDTGKNIKDGWQLTKMLAPSVLGIASIPAFFTNPTLGMALGAASQGITQIPSIKPLYNDIKNKFKTSREQGKSLWDSTKHAFSNGNLTNAISIASTPVSVAAGGLSLNPAYAKTAEKLVASSIGLSRINTAKYQADQLEKQIDKYVEQKEFEKLPIEQQQTIIRNKQIEKLNKLKAMQNQLEQQINSTPQTPQTPQQKG